jgi:hypothetical protein
MWRGQLEASKESCAEILYFDNDLMNNTTVL